MIMSFVQILNIIGFSLIIVGIVFFYAQKRKRLKQTGETKNKSKVLSKLIIVLISFFVIGIMIFGYIYESTKWEKVTMNEQDKIQIATSELLLPELAAYMNCQYKRSVRDISYLYDTCWFGDADELFEVLNYAEENDRVKAKQMLQNNKVETLEFNSLEGGNMTVYQISENGLPVQNAQLRGENWQYHYRYEYYVIFDSYYNNRAKLICVKSGY